MPADDRLLTPYRIIRRLEPPEAPLAGLLVHAREACVLVDVDIVGDDWLGWSAARDGHVLAPLDLVRTTDGHAVALPVCDERILDLLTRRADSPLTDGEILTLTVSVLRGLAEAVSLSGSGDSTGSWWLVDGARPVFVAHPDGDPIALAAEILLQQVMDAASRRLADALGEALEATREPARLMRRLHGLEERLFSCAAPEPLATTVYAPRRARALAPVLTADVPRLDDEREPGLVARFARHVDADLADTVSRATTALWRRFRRGGSERRARPALVAGVTAALVVAGGLLWPAGGGPATAEGGEVEHASPAPSVTDSAAASIPAGEVAATGSPSAEPDSIENVVADLLDRRVACAGDAGCLAAVVEDPSEEFPAGAVDASPSSRTITLLDDFGGVAVVRVDAGDEPQLVVVIRVDEEWVLRDVHDVAEHPMTQEP